MPRFVRGNRPNQVVEAIVHTSPDDDHVSDALDAALQMTFPASDPVAVFVPEAVKQEALSTQTL